MARFRLSRLAQSDLRHILATSATQWGADGRRRYSVLLAAAMLKVAGDPEGPAVRDRPVHILYYRVVRSDLVEIVRVLHERMEPSRYIGAGSRD